MSIEVIFLICVFAAVLLLSQALFLPVYRPQRGDTRVIQERLKQLAKENAESGDNVSLLRRNRLQKASPLGRSLEELPFVQNISFKLEQSGSKLLGHQFLGLALLSAIIISFLLWMLSNDWLLALLTFLGVLALFNFKMNRDFDKRMELIEIQFPEALDILRRGLQAGYAFSDSIKLAFEEMDGPLAFEFQLIFADINYGKDTKRALLRFVERVPSVSAMAFSSAVQVQKETGGNLAENMKNLSRVIRQRFTFKRKVKSMSAEGRMSAWVLVLMPLGLFAFLFLTSPSYAKELTDTESGNRLLLYGAIGMMIGTYWIGRLIRLEV
ncbi:type II secretion system F family protein [Ferrimonas aestuarii]|uniref:Type II secretion system F family protein n=1 Tax=Ferrimonas aestuarii TaxID=2569539 RepID=A0A4V6WMU3_9GAMM|nr:type II secretion system F family protein [Ferrimonas aestuarii]TKB58418.1 type II secretion system F family protein [Ferrimonas aestuarii]